MRPVWLLGCVLILLTCTEKSVPVPAPLPPLARSVEPAPPPVPVARPANPPTTTPAPDAAKLAGGVLSVRLAPGAGTMPSQPESLAFDFTCMGINGDVERGRGALHGGRLEQCLYVVGRGLGPVLHLMEDGEQRRFWVPTSNGYRMIDVTMPARPPMPPGLTEPTTATKVAEGVSYQTLEQGSGSRVTAPETVQVLLTGRTPDGRVFDTRSESSKPMVMVLPGDGVLFRLFGSMREGEVSRVWIDQAAGVNLFDHGVEADQIVDVKLLKKGAPRRTRTALGLPISTGCSPACAAGEVCVAHEVQCKKDPCPADLECVLDE